ncbi:MAG TPA: hypothetical protein PLZ21_00485 [Armatimonadota bacterium]|nr:hypothetical protein [Armatimonadota bacterium]
MTVRAIINSNKGSGMVVGLFTLLILSAFGLSFLSVAMSAVVSAKRTDISARALQAAEAGVERAISYLRGTAPNGTADGSWRTQHPSANPNNHIADTFWSEDLPNGDSFQLCVRDAGGGDATKIVITSTGIAHFGDATTTKTIRVLLERAVENVSPWNNVIFGGVGQAGRSINGNVKMRGPVHLLGDGESFTDIDGDGKWDDNEPYTDSNSNGQYDVGEPFTDVDGDGHRDAREPFIDVNGNGTRDPALTVTDIAEEISGNADVGTNYNGMPVKLRNKIPNPPTKLFGGENVETLSAKLRVKHGKVNISGSACAGYPNIPGNSVKETLDGVYVSDGWGGNKGASSVYSDNGAAHGYDLGDGVVKFPALIDPYPPYATYADYLADNSLTITGPLSFSTTSFSLSDDKGNSITY